MPVVDLTGQPAPVPLTSPPAGLRGPFPLSGQPASVPLCGAGLLWLVGQPALVNLELEAFYSPRVPVVAPPAAVGDVTILQSNAIFPAPTLDAYGRPT